MEWETADGTRVCARVNGENKLLEYWKGLLGLQDWTIKLTTNCRACDMFLENCAGATEWTERRKHESVGSQKSERVDSGHRFC